MYNTNEIRRYEVLMLDDAGDEEKDLTPAGFKCYFTDKEVHAETEKLSTVNSHEECLEPRATSIIYGDNSSNTEYPK